jgi:hypothetical protein
LDLEGTPESQGSTLSAFPFHPLLFAAYFVLSLVGLNISQLYLSDSLRSLVIALFISTLLWILLGAIFKSARRGAIAASLLLFSFFVYGHVYHFLEGSFPALGRHRLLLPIWLALTTLGFWLISKRLKNPVTLTKTLNLMALVALIFPAYQVLSWETLQAEKAPTPLQESQLASETKLDTAQPAPDVYLIIVDMYGRQDLLQEIYGFDNSPFLDDLRQMGFEIADCSQSNYSQTELTLASLLNMDYLDNLGNLDDSTRGKSALRSLIQDNSVMSAFTSMGYKLVSFATGYSFSEFTQADFYLYPTDNRPAFFERLNLLIRLL